MSVRRPPSFASKNCKELTASAESVELSSFRVAVKELSNRKTRNDGYLDALSVEEEYMISAKLDEEPQRSSEEENQIPLSIALGDAVASLQFDEMLIFAGLRLLIALTIFIFVSVLLGSEKPTHQLFNQSSAVSAALAPEHGGDPLKSVQFRDIGDVEDVYEWLTKTFIPSVFAMSESEQDHRGYLDLRNQVLGGVILERTPMRVRKCNSSEAIIQLQPYCLLPADTNKTSIFLDIKMNATQAVAVINKLKRRGSWLNYQSKQLRVTVATYNSDIDTFSVTRLDVNFRRDGVIEPRVSTKSVSDYREQHMVQSIVVVGIGVVYYAALLVYIEMVKAPSNPDAVWHQKGNGSFRAKLWQGLQTLLLLCAPFGAIPVFFVVLLKVLTMDIDESILNLVDSNTKHDAFAALRGVITALDAAVVWVDALSVVGAVTIIQLGLFVIRQLRFHPRLNVFARTIEHSLRQFRDFFVIFIIIFLTFSCAGNSLFGKKVIQFSTASNSLVSCVNMLFQTFDYNSIREFHGAGVFYWSYMVVVNIVLLNMMLAIVMGVYQDIIQEGYDGDVSRQLMVRIRKNYPFKALLKSFVFWRNRGVERLVPTSDHPARTEPINTDSQNIGGN